MQANVGLALSMKSPESKQGKRTGISISKSCKVPKLLTYGMLVAQLRTIEIGTVHEIDQDYMYLEELETENPVNGCFVSVRGLLKS